MIDLRSDTVTRPTVAMRAAIAAADVGDDASGDDPTINALEERVAGMFGAEAALFVPSGTMSNQVALRAYATAGTEVVVEAASHVVNYENGAGAVLSGVQFRTVPAPNGLFTPELVGAAISHGAQYHLTPTSAVFIEQTHNRHGGTYLTIAELAAIRAAVPDGVNIFMDGARLFNALVAGDMSAADTYAQVDGLGFCLSKGLGAPVGSMVVGSSQDMDVARLWRHRYGGGMRQAGILAAAGLYALDHHVDRLADDHANAQMLAERIGNDCPDSISHPVMTNLVYVETGDRSATELVTALHDAGVACHAMAPTTLRFVTHLDVTREQCEHAAAIIATTLG